MGSQARKVRALGLARMPALGSVGAATELAEVACVVGGETQVDFHPMPLSNLTSQCLFAAFLVRFADSGEGASGDSGGEAGAMVAWLVGA